MKQATTQTVRAQNHVARQSAIDFLAETAERQPSKVVGVLLVSPELTAGLKDFDFLVDKLLRGGQRDKLMLLAEAPALRQRERKVLVDRLLVA